MFTLGLAAFAALFTVVSAQAEAADSVELTVAESAEFGEHIATDTGYALYLYEEDEEGVSNCEGACANNWPPLLVEDADSVTAGDDVDSDLIATTEREDGSVQVTYAGHPL
ncbi:MAG TPA: hypothetical protein VK092_01890, partial [Deinococcales bacterium]|nr:hypothetical protein [Deinococcales bacterium]